MAAGVLPKGEAIEKNVHAWTDKFDQIIQAAALPNPLQQPHDELPVIQQDEDISVEDIPL